MGCDIHAMYERKTEYWWANAGDPDIGRNYTIFSVLADVRNEDNVPYIDKNRITVDSETHNNLSSVFESWIQYYGDDGHSHSYVTLEEMKEYDVNQTYDSNRLIMSKDDTGKVTGTCQSTTGDHLGKIGKTTIFGVWGTESWDNLISYGEDIRVKHDLTDKEVRLVFFFDN